MAREEERDPERREAAARARGEEEEEEEEGLSDSDDEDQDEKKTGSGGEEEKEAAAGRERSEDARLQGAGLPPAAVLAAAARDRSGCRSPGPPRGPLPCLSRMPSPEEEDRERRRSRRRDLLLSQLCFLALVALLLWSLSSRRERDGECGRRRARAGRGARGRAAPSSGGRADGAPRARTSRGWASGARGAWRPRSLCLRLRGLRFSPAGWGTRRRRRGLVARAGPLKPGMKLLRHLCT